MNMMYTCCYRLTHICPYYCSSCSRRPHLYRISRYHDLSPVPAVELFLRMSHSLVNLELLHCYVLVSIESNEHD